MLTKYDALGNPIGPGVPGYFSAEWVLSGSLTTYTVTAAALAAVTTAALLCNSNSGTAKTIVLPASIGSRKRIWVLDAYGDANLNAIAITISGGATIVGQPSITTINGQLWLTDTMTSGWVSGL